MSLGAWFERGQPVAGAPGGCALRVSVEEWGPLAQSISTAGGRLLALWTSGEIPPAVLVRAAYICDRGFLIAEVLSPEPGRTYPGLEDVFPAASRMQRAAADLTGARSSDPDMRPWLRHAAWPASMHPLLDDRGATPEEGGSIDAYEFVRVAGDGVHEIPVGPVHAGIIEPGHFRFSIVGEKVLKLEERLGYAHKGIERRFTDLALLEGHRLAARVSGDSAVAFSWAYCQALEGMSGVEIPARAAWLRAACLELERIANHLGDLGALGNDAGFAFGLAQFSRLKEAVLRATDAAFGQRYLNDTLVPGGVRTDLETGTAARILRCVAQVRDEAALLRTIYEEHSGVRDRFVGAGLVTAELAARLGLVGLAGRASGQPYDLRADLPCTPYRDVVPIKAGSTEGDVAARVAVRFDELRESCALVQRLIEGLPTGSHAVSVPAPESNTLGVGLIEGWRGPVLVALEAGANGRIRRCHPHDPSWQNWPVLEHAVIGNIVPDFPLINKSFNLSYSGHDL